MEDADTVRDVVIAQLRLHDGSALFSVLPVPGKVETASILINGIVGPLIWNYNDYGWQTKHLLKVGLSRIRGRDRR